MGMNKVTLIAPALNELPSMEDKGSQIIYNDGG
jgi:hypothetical protein